MAVKQLIKRANSKAQLKTFVYNKKAQTVFPDFSFDAVEQLINEDPVARGAINHFVDKMMEGDYAIIKKDTKKYDDVFEMILDTKYNFRHHILRKLAIIGLLYNTAFIEIVKTLDNETKDLNVLDSYIIEPITAFNGDPIKYRSKIPTLPTGIFQEWPASNIVWFKFGDRTRGFPPVDVRALYETLQIKRYIRRYVGWLWQTGQYRLLYNFKDASEQDVQDFLAFSRRNDHDFKQPFIVKGEMETRLLREMKEIDSLVNYEKYLDSQILILLRIPPIDAGIPDASGRANADAQGNSLGSRITSFKKAIEDTVNFELFPKINHGNNLLRFGPNDRFSEKQVFEILQLMKSMNMTDDVCIEYLQDRGMFFKAEKVFNEPELMEGGNPRSKDMAPSRMGKGTGEGNKAQAKPTTRPDQVSKQ